MLKILIVDDDPQQRMLVSAMVAKLGSESQEAEDGIKAVPAALNWQPDVILLDLMMPEQDGLETCVQLRNAGYTGYILLATAFYDAMSRSGGVKSALEAGANDLLQKPIALKELEKRLAAIEANE